MAILTPGAPPMYLTSCSRRRAWRERLAHRRRESRRSSPRSMTTTFNRETLLSSIGMEDGILAGATMSASSNGAIFRDLVYSELSREILAGQPGANAPGSRGTTTPHISLLSSARRTTEAIAQIPSLLVTAEEALAEALGNLNQEAERLGKASSSARSTPPAVETTMLEFPDVPCSTWQLGA